MQTQPYPFTRPATAWALKKDTHMPKLHELREAKALKIQEARSLVNGDTALTPEGKTRFDALKAEITSLEADEQRAQYVEDLERRSLGTVDKGHAALESKVTLLEAVTAQVEQRAAGGALGEYQAEMARAGVTAKHGGVLVPSSLFHEQRTTMLTTGNAAIVPARYRVAVLRGSSHVPAVLYQHLPQRHFL